MIMFTGVQGHGQIIYESITTGATCCGRAVLELIASEPGGGGGGAYPRHLPQPSLSRETLP